MNRIAVLAVAVGLVACTTARSGPVTGDVTPAEVAVGRTPTAAAPDGTEPGATTAPTAMATAGLGRFGLQDAPAGTARPRTRPPSPAPRPAERATPADTGADAGAGDEDGAPADARESRSPRPEPAPARADSSRLWGRTFASRGVTEDGAPRPLVDGTEIRVTFEKRRGGDAVRWHAGCNTAGGKVTVAPDRLNVTEIASTAIGCDDDRQRQDAWVNDFFAGRPFWRLNGDRLTLRVGDTVIRFREA